MRIKERVEKLEQGARAACVSIAIAFARDGESSDQAIERTIRDEGLATAPENFLVVSFVKPSLAQRA